MLRGRKTYITAAVGAAIALAGAYFGVLSTDTAVQLLVGAAGIAGLRSGLTTEIARALAARAAEEGQKQRAEEK